MGFVSVKVTAKVQPQVQSRKVLKHRILRYCFVFFAYSLVDTLLFSCLPICVLVSFLFTWLVSVLVSFACQVTLALSCLWTILGFVCVCSFVFVIICLILYLPFVWGSSFVSYFVLLFLCFCFNPL